MPNSSNLSKLIDKYNKDEKQQENNKNYIIETLKSSNKILAAWGRKYHRKVQWLFEYLENKELYVYGINSDSSPRHFAPQAYNRIKKYNRQQNEIGQNQKTEQRKILF